MRSSSLLRLVLAGLLLVPIALPVVTFSQALTLPPSGGNQPSSVIQAIGSVEVRIDYSSPDVTGPNGADRRGEIWGQLVPYGVTNLGFGTSSLAPWRAGANENTVFTVSQDVEIEGEALKAGRYGLHMIAEEDESRVGAATSGSASPRGTPAGFAACHAEDGPPPARERRPPACDP